MSAIFSMCSFISDEEMGSAYRRRYAEDNALYCLQRSGEVRWLAGLGRCVPGSEAAEREVRKSGMGTEGKMGREGARWGPGE